MLAKYFSDRASKEAVSSRKVSRQPFVIAQPMDFTATGLPQLGLRTVWSAHTSSSAMSARCEFNRQRVAHAVHYCLRARSFFDAERELCNLEVLYARFAMGYGSEIVPQLRVLQDEMNNLSIGEAMKLLVDRGEGSYLTCFPPSDTYKH